MLTASNALLFKEKRVLEKEVTNLKSDLEGAQRRHTLSEDEKHHEICQAIKEAKVGERRKASANIRKEKENSEKSRLKLDCVSIERIVSHYESVWLC